MTPKSVSVSREVNYGKPLIEYTKNRREQQHLRYPPAGAVVVGRGGGLDLPKGGTFRGWAVFLYYEYAKWREGDFSFRDPDFLYAVAKGHEIAERNPPVEYTGFYQDRTEETTD